MNDDRGEGGDVGRGDLNEEIGGSGDDVDDRIRYEGLGLSRVLRFQSGDDDGRLGEEMIGTVQDESETVLAGGFLSSEVASRLDISLEVPVGIRGEQASPSDPEEEGE